MYKGNYSVRRIPEVVAHSGSALIHFYSDVAYNMTGFNITYRSVFNTFWLKFCWEPCLILILLLDSILARAGTLISIVLAMVFVLMVFVLVMLSTLALLVMCQNALITAVAMITVIAI